MESNKEEALRCLDLSKRYWAEGNTERAQKFLEKSIRLYPTEEANTFGSILRKGSPSPNGAAARDSPVRHRKPTATSTERKEEAEDAKNYSSEQVSAVKKILKCKDYYEILGVSKEASDSDLKKAYRKLALQFHPDKNQAPGASDAFKAIGNAFAVLSDKEKRERYDQFGPEAAANDGQRYHRHHFESDLSADEVFNMFFGGGFPNTHVRRHGRFEPRTQYYYGDPDTGAADGVELLRIAPLFFLICVYLLGNIISNLESPIYQLTPGSEYSVLRRTETTTHRVPYYVRESFEEEYASDRRTLYSVEHRVESEYLQGLQRNCYMEKVNKQRQIEIARFYADERALREAEGRRLPGCEALDKLRQQARVR